MTRSHSQAKEFHHISCRLALEDIANEPRLYREPPMWVRTSGHILLCTIVAVVCYSAAL